MPVRSLRVLAAAVKYRTFHWLPTYRRHMRSVRDCTLGPDSHVVLTFVDHFEPSRSAGQRGVDDVEAWCQRYAESVRGFTDSEGRQLQHTWFYRFDYPNDACMRHIASATYQGLGEIEFHLHHGHDTRETFAQAIGDGVRWFNRWGAMIGFCEEMPRRFAYIAGNWALDNGQGDDSKSGVNDEIGVLAEHGCYADFTFPAFGERSQPRQVNSIYYAKAGPEAKSYDSGVPLSRGSNHDGDLLIFQGPILLDLRNGVVDYGAFESYAPYESGRIRNWIKSRVHVGGQPDWIFVKIHTHGMQSRKAVLGHQLQLMLADADALAKETGVKFHFATAREAYNMAMAAAAGCEGEPAQYRDWKIPPPVNRYVRTSCPVVYREARPGCIDLDIEGGPCPLDMNISIGPVARIEGGSVDRVRVCWDHSDNRVVEIEGSGDAMLRSRSQSGDEAEAPEAVTLPARVRIP